MNRNHWCFIFSSFYDIWPQISETEPWEELFFEIEKVFTFHRNLIYFTKRFKDITRGIRDWAMRHEVLKHRTISWMIQWSPGEAFTRSHNYDSYSVEIYCPIQSRSFVLIFTLKFSLCDLDSEKSQCCS